ncbi:MAG: efflux RND transporter periplasmic adaptor subunit [Sulfuricurvum sp.]
MKSFGIAMAAAALLLSGCVKSAEEKEIKEVNNETVLRLEGYVRPIDEAKVKTSIAGEIEIVLKRNGDRVTKGDVIAVYNKRPILIEMEKVRAKIRAKEQALGHYRKGGGGGPENQAVIDNAKLQLQKIAQLYHMGAASKIEFDNAEDRYLTLLVSEESRRFSESSQYKSRAEDRGALQEYYGELARLQYELERINIIAATNGFLTNFKLQSGQSVSDNTDIGEIVNIDNVIVYGALATGLFPYVKEGQKVKISFLTTPGITRMGIIDRIVPVVDPQLGRMVIQVPLKNPNYALQPSVKGLIEVSLSKRDQAKVRQTYYESDKRSKYVDDKSNINGDYTKMQKY